MFVNQINLNSKKYFTIIICLIFIKKCIKKIRLIFFSNGGFLNGFACVFNYAGFQESIRKGALNGIRNTGHIADGSL